MGRLLEVHGNCLGNCVFVRVIFRNVRIIINNKLMEEILMLNVKVLSVCVIALTILVIAHIIRK